MSTHRPASPAVEAFATLVRLSVEALERDVGTAGTDGEGLLFLGVWSDALPRLLIEDPVLSPTDKIVWQVIKLRAQAGSATAFPSYQTIGRLANVRAQATIARAIAILRTSRWLTLCARVRDPRGRYRGNVYALHDEPLDLADTLYLDPDYMRFLGAAAEHRHARVRAVATAARATIADDVGRGVDVTQTCHALARRAEAMRTVYEQTQGGFYSFNRASLTQLRRSVTAEAETLAPEGEHAPPSADSEVGAIAEPEMSSTTAPEHQETEKCEVGGREKTEHGGPSKSEVGDGGCSSSYLYIKTTTTEPGETREKNFRGLAFPEALGANHQALAIMYLDAVAPDLRQPVLDELEGRLRAQHRGAPAIYDPLRFLHRLCEAARSGNFHPNLGVAVRDARQRARAAASRPPREPGAPELPPANPNHPLVKRALRIQASRAQHDATTDPDPGDRPLPADPNAP